jgi:hypothetical protein
MVTRARIDDPLSGLNGRVGDIVGNYCGFTYLDIEGNRYAFHPDALTVVEGSVEDMTVVTTPVRILDEKSPLFECVVDSVRYSEGADTKYGVTVEGEQIYFNSSQVTTSVAAWTDNDILNNQQLRMISAADHCEALAARARLLRRAVFKFEVFSVKWTSSKHYDGTSISRINLKNESTMEDGRTINRQIYVSQLPDRWDSGKNPDRMFFSIVKSLNVQHIVVIDEPVMAQLYLDMQKVVMDRFELYKRQGVNSQLDKLLANMKHIAMEQLILASIRNAECLVYPKFDPHTFLVNVKAAIR